MYTIIKTFLKKLVNIRHTYCSACRLYILVYKDIILKCFIRSSKTCLKIRLGFGFIVRISAYSNFVAVYILVLTPPSNIYLYTHSNDWRTLPPCASGTVPVTTQWGWLVSSWIFCIHIMSISYHTSWTLKWGVTKVFTYLAYCVKHV